MGEKTELKFYFQDGTRPVSLEDIVGSFIVPAQLYRIGEALEYLINNPNVIFEHISDNYRFTLSYNPENKEYIFNAYLENEEISNFYIEDLMSTEVKWEVKTNLLSFNDAFKDAIANNKLIKHRDMYAPIDYQDFFNDYKKSEVKKMISEKAWEVF